MGRDRRGLMVSWLVAASLVAAACRDRTPEPIRVGLLVPLTGRAAPLGEYARNGADLAVREINAAGGAAGRPIQLIAEDSQSTEAGGVPAYQKLSAADRVVASIGLLNEVMVPAAGIADRQDTVLVNLDAQDPQLRKIDSAHVFSLVPDATMEAPRMARYAFETLGVRRVVTMYLENDPGVTAVRAFDQAFRALGGTVALEEMVDKNRELAKLPESMARVRAARPQAIYIVAPPRLKFRALRFADDAAWQTTWLTDASMELDAQADALGPIADGVLYTSARPFAEEGSVARRFASAYRRRFAIAPDRYAALAYEAVYALRAAAERAQGTMTGDVLAKRLRDAPMNGLTIDIDFRRSRFLERPLEVKQVKAGRGILVEASR